VKLNLKVLSLVIIAVLIISSVYAIFSNEEENIDDTPPIIVTIAGDLSGNKGETVTIFVTFSDDTYVTNATLYYKTKSDTDWVSKSILSGSMNISLNFKENLYYYVTVDDAAGNGPIGDPSINGSIYYTITILEDDDEDEEYIRNVFVEEGSLTNCQYCPIVGEWLYELYSSVNYNFYYVTLIMANDKASDRLNNEYNLLGLPTVFVDGGYKVIMGGSHEKSEYAQAIRDAESRAVPDVRVKVTTEFDNESDNIISNVLVVNKDNEKYDGRLRVYLTEKISRWSGLEGKPYHFGFLDFIIDKKISIDTNQNVTFQETRSISNLDPENLMIIAVVFNADKKEGYSDPPRNKHQFDAYYADAVDGTEIVEGGNLPPSVGFSLPELGKLHLRGRAIYKFKLHKNTVLIGKTTVAINTEDDQGIEKVELYIDGSLVDEYTEEPYEYNFRKFNSFKRIISKHTLKVIAYDNEGKTGERSIDIIAFLL
jgi:hypothetical protein